jgi:hypothetical protein
VQGGSLIPRSGKGEIAYDLVQEGIINHGAMRKSCCNAKPEQFRQVCSRLRSRQRAGRRSKSSWSANAIGCQAVRVRWLRQWQRWNGPGVVGVASDRSQFSAPSSEVYFVVFSITCGLAHLPDLKDIQLTLEVTS